MRDKIFKASVEELEGYKPEPQEAQALLNANENPYNLPQELREKILEEIKKIDFNRYPDPFSTELIETFAETVDVRPNQVIAGSGLDEILSIIVNATISPGDTVISHKPGFSMYEIWTKIAGGDFIGVEDKNNQINTAEIINESIRHDAKLIFICAPNNPTGYLISRAELEQILEETQALVVLDEAYADFAESDYLDLLDTYDNLIVLRTLSKAYRVPALRCGFGIGNPKIVEVLRKIKSPYNLNMVTQVAAKTVLDNTDQLEEVVEKIKKDRDDLYLFLERIPEIIVYPSKANFLYIKTPKHAELQKALLDKGVLVRYYPEDEAFRITIGTEEENNLIKDAVKEVF